MYTQHTDLMEPLIEQQPTRRRPGKGYQEQMLYFFGIIIILIGVGSLAILHVRTRPARATSKLADNAASFEANIQRSTSDELQWLNQALGLLPSQQSKIRPVVEAEVRARTALMETPSLSISEQDFRLVELRNHTLERIRPVLTPPQQITLRELEQEGSSSTD
jgi:hypothetical protein